jgi:hypothetical protein
MIERGADERRTGDLDRVIDDDPIERQIIDCESSMLAPADAPSTFPAS